ncbi:hypothetical protein LAG90_15650 [Marinilongibacter aquaticus]|uniref:hypothetical protein n=1 Tax=Marinilongibacter aquaticus TaxID=2975157 RepID=UPI0021BD5B9E|nr:hypothetical protein [Marinilongibacter aquaticus]UBM58238.1 hypothetical protein LAG90_15650 [Marinilongibacter aquaticus]
MKEVIEKLITELLESEQMFYLKILDDLNSNPSRIDLVNVVADRFFQLSESLRHLAKVC